MLKTFNLKMFNGSWNLFMGQAAWAFGGFLLSVAGLLTSPVLLALLGLGALAAYFGLPM